MVQQPSAQPDKHMLHGNESWCALIHQIIAAPQHLRNTVSLSIPNVSIPRSAALTGSIHAAAHDKNAAALPTECNQQRTSPSAHTTWRYEITAGPKTFGCCPLQIWRHNKKQQLLNQKPSSGTIPLPQGIDTWGAVRGGEVAAGSACASPLPSPLCNTAQLRENDGQTGISCTSALRCERGPDLEAGVVGAETSLL